MARTLRWFSLALAGLSLCVYVVLAVLRAGHPFELEWQEGGMLAHVERVDSGQPLYAEPSLEFIAFPYTPLYVWASAAASAVLGRDFLALRAVSIAASMAALWFLYRIAARRGGSPAAGLLAAGLFAASYRFCGAWFDVARVDSASIALTLAAIDVLDARRGIRGALFAGGIFFLAFFAKQSALVVAAGAFVGLAFTQPRAALAGAALFASLSVASTVAYDAVSDGWFSWYVLELVAGHRFLPEMALRFVHECGLAFAPAIALAAWSAWESRRPRGTHDTVPTNATVLLGALAGLVAAAWIGRAHVGGYDNTLLPACAAAAIVFGPALHVLASRTNLLGVAAGLLGIVQFGLLAYDPREQVPTQADVRAGEHLVERMRTAAGPIWAPDHGYLAVRAGRGAAAHGMAVVDLLQGADHGAARRFVEQLERALEERRYSAVVLDHPWESDLPALERNYRKESLPYPSESAFVTVTGDPRRPRWWYSRREDK